MAPEDREREHGLEHLRERAADLRGLLDALPLATAVKDAEGLILYINAAAAAGYGLSPAEMIGRADHELLPPGNDPLDVLAKDREVLESGRALTVPGQRFRTFEGRHMVLHMIREPVRFGGVPAVMVTAMDVTSASSANAERRQIERRLAESQRLEGLGLMAGAIAHDFNNLLVGVLASADMALVDTSLNERTRGFLQRIASAANRLAGLARQMLTYSGRGPANLQPIDVASLAREMMELVASSIPPTVRVLVDLPEDLPAVAGDHAQLGQVLVNLVVNAAEAIGADVPGVIRVSARREYLDSNLTASLSVRSLRGAADFLCLEVSDDGPGMDEATRERIFDPFFSTKGKRGRGLGLASVIGIVRAHQGALQVDSVLHEGTRMRVWLPLAQERARIKSLRPARVHASRAASGHRVLVVDDESVVREIAVAVLEARGFTVLSAADGTAAIEVAQSAGSVDLVLLDMTMPGPSVDEVHRALRSALPGVRVLLTSGYSEPVVLGKLLEEPGTSFLQKPFSASTLVEQVHALLK
ncbi:MAG: ATP-binding protein [Myxococcales bacterium]